MAQNNSFIRWEDGNEPGDELLSTSECIQVPTETHLSGQERKLKLNQQQKGPLST